MDTKALAIHSHSYLLIILHNSLYLLGTWGYYTEHGGIYIQMGYIYKQKGFFMLVGGVNSNDIEGTLTLVRRDVGFGKNKHQAIGVNITKKHCL